MTFTVRRRRRAFGDRLEDREDRGEERELSSQFFWSKSLHTLQTFVVANDLIISVKNVKLGRRDNHGVVVRYPNVYSTSMVRGHNTRSYLCNHGG